MSAWDACTQDPHWLIRQFECHPASGAYLTLGAIAAAIWVGWATIRAENKRIKARGRVAAFRLAPFVVNILGDSYRAQAVLDRLFEAPPVTFPSIQSLLQQLSVANGMPEDIFSETWTMPPHVGNSGTFNPYP